jgi:hypothetical protein
MAFGEGEQCLEVHGYGSRVKGAAIVAHAVRGRKKGPAQEV